MIDLFNKLQSAINYPLSKTRKYILIFLQTSIFFATIDQIVKYIQANNILLPSGKVINKNDLDLNSKASLHQHIEMYEKNLLAEKNSFKENLLPQIAAKIFSE
jgi:hypothetical protein